MICKVAKENYYTFDNATSIDDLSLLVPLSPIRISITFPYEQTLSASVYIQSGPLPSQAGTQRPLLWSLLSMESSKKRSVIDLLFRLKRGVI